jgi:hypothetical protein
MSERGTISEKLYALLLRLYPARFRRQYGEEAMRVFRERLRDERGRGARRRLWLELLLDVGASLPREYRRGGPSLAAVPASAQAGLPLFRSIETRLPNPGSFLGGAIMAFVAVVAFGFLLNHGGKVRHYATYYAARQAQASVPSSAATLSTGQGPGGAGSPATSAGRGSSGTVLPAQGAQANAAQNALHGQRVPAVLLDDAARRRILASVEATLRESYPYPQMAALMAGSLDANEDRGAYELLSNPGDFADAVTKQMRAISGDSGLVLYFIATPLPKTRAAGDIHWIDAHFLLRVPLPQTAPGRPVAKS